MTAKGKLRDEFLKQIDRLCEWSTAFGKETTNNGQSDWYVPPGEAPDLQDWESLSDSFDRTALVQDMASILESKSSIGVDGDYALVQLQHDFIAVLERAYRLRHSSFCRCMAMSAGRAAGHGNSGGPIQMLLRGYLERIEKANKDSSE